MNNYFEFLSEEEQTYLNDNRFTGLNDWDMAAKLKYALYNKYNINLGADTPIPTNHQIDAYLQLTSKHDEERGLVGAMFMEQGLGKSKMAIMFADYLYRKKVIGGMIVIAPNNLKYQWVEEQVPIHYPGKVDSIVWDGFNTQGSKKVFSEVIKSTGKLKVFAINVEAFSSASIKQYVHMFMDSCGDALIVVDESTTIKNGRRAPKGRSKRAGAKRTNLILDGFSKRKNKLILTGTATPNRPFDLWAQFEFLRYDYFNKDYWTFCKYHGEMIHVKRHNATRLSLELLDQKTFSLVKSDIENLHINECLIRNDCRVPVCDIDTCPNYKAKGFSPWDLEEIALRRGLTESGVLRIEKMKELIQFKNLEELKESMSPITSFRKTREVLDMPAQIYEKLSCSLSNEQKKLYNDMVKDMMAEYEGDALSTLFKQVLFIRCQQITGGLFPYPVDIIKKGLDGEVNEIKEYKTKRITPNGKLNALSTALDDIDPDQSIIYWAWFTGEQELIYEMLCKKYGSQRVGLYRDNKKEVEQAFKAGEIKHFVSGDSGSFGLNLQVSHLQYFYSNNHRADIRDQKEKRSHRIGQVYPVTYIDIVAKGTKDQTILDVLHRKMDLIEFFRKGEDYDRT